MTEKKRDIPAHLKDLPTSGGSYARTDAGGKYQPEKPPAGQTPDAAADGSETTTKRGKR